MNLRERAQKFLQQNQPLRSNQIDYESAEDEWITFRENLGD
jgi:hypothetical protein